LLHRQYGNECIILENQLLREDKAEGLLLRLEKLVEIGASGPSTLQDAQYGQSVQRFLGVRGQDGCSGETSPIASGLTSGLF
jgi:hypothetical protein